MTLDLKNIRAGIRGVISRENKIKKSNLFLAFLTSVKQFDISLALTFQKAG